MKKHLLTLCVLFTISSCTTNKKDSNKLLMEATKDALTQISSVAKMTHYKQIFIDHNNTLSNIVESSLYISPTAYKYTEVQLLDGIYIFQGGGRIKFNNDISFKAVEEGDISIITNFILKSPDGAIINDTQGYNKLYIQKPIMRKEFTPKAVIPTASEKWETLELNTQEEPYYLLVKEIDNNFSIIYVNKDSSDKNTYVLDYDSTITEADKTSHIYKQINI